MNSIIPKSKAKGIDICGRGDWYYYIIRSDLGCFMMSRNLHKGSDISIWSLHPNCKNGDHYMADWNGYFYIIKGDSVRRVSNLETDDEAEVYHLHPNCQGGDHYLATTKYFYVIFQEKGTYRKTTNIYQDPDGAEYNLHPEFRNGLYYWGVQHLISFIKPVTKWGVDFFDGTDLTKYDCHGIYSVHLDVLNFLPGGLSVTKGPAFGKWENIKTITNDSNSTVTWQKKINKKVGYDKEKMTEMTHNWKISASVAAETRGLAALIAKVQFSFSAEYGGSHVSTDKESWNELTEEEETLTFELKPNESVYLWQYKLGLGKDPVLFCRDLKIDDKPNPPTGVPLPPAQS